jgi:hypothetical protein
MNSIDFRGKMIPGLLLITLLSFSMIYDIGRKSWDQKMVSICVGSSDRVSQPHWSRCFPGNASMLAIVREIKPKLIASPNVRLTMMSRRAANDLQFEIGLIQTALRLTDSL